MSFVFVGGDASSNPTYFEVFAADNLVSSLRSAILYSSSVFAQRRRWLRTVLEFEDEFLALVTLLINERPLLHDHASFAEKLYGLKRSRIGTENAADSQATMLQRRLSLLLEVLLPYIGTKLDGLYRHYTRGGILGLAIANSAQNEDYRDRLQRHIHTFKTALRKAFVKVYPYTYAAWELVKALNQLLYIVDITSSHSPILRLLGLRLVRISGAEMAQQQQARQRERSARLAALQGAPLLRQWLGTARLAWSWVAQDHARNALVLLVFAFKALEWWFVSAEQQLAAGQVLPPPPPPPPPLPSPNGVGLPRDITLCPLCRQKRTNPALAAVSGYVFCYPCLYTHVAEHASCPVTLAPMTAEHIRKLYDT